MRVMCVLTAAWCLFLAADLSAGDPERGYRLLTEKAYTLWHVLHPGDRPAVWRGASEDGYDREKAGLEIETLSEIPATVTAPREQREYFDTRRFGKSAAGHGFPNALTEEEKDAVLEFLKTL